MNSDDLKIYKTIVIATNAHKKHIAKIIEHTGDGILLRYMIAIEDRQPDYVYWNDPNELVDRLRLLYASQAAGNASHTNEITH